MQIPGYRIERELGRGGMATVYLAVQNSLQRRVALKVMKPALAKDEAFTARFLREGPTVAALTHPNIVKVFDTGAHGEHYYLSMEYLSGGNLKQRLHGMSLEESLEVFKGLASALGYAHHHGIIHRDIKPQNILFYDSGAPVLSDFGIAKTLSHETALTATGTYIGSVNYMSPEQIQGKGVDGRSDLYSLGVLFYELLMGEPPFSGDDQFTIAYHHINAPMPPLPPVLAPFQDVLERLLAKSPDRRYTDAQTLLQHLRYAEQQHFAATAGFSAPGVSLAKPPYVVEPTHPSAYPSAVGIRDGRSAPGQMVQPPPPMATGRGRSTDHGRVTQNRRGLPPSATSTSRGRQTGPGNTSRSGSTSRSGQWNDEQTRIGTQTSTVARRRRQSHWQQALIAVVSATVVGLAVALLLYLYVTPSSP